jgi:hypothetical protein
MGEQAADTVLTLAYELQSTIGYGSDRRILEAVKWLRRQHEANEHLRSQLAAVTKELEEAKEIIEGNAAMRAEFSQLSDSFVVEQNAHALTTRKLATAVEALEWYAIDNHYGHTIFEIVTRARQALAAIRAQETKSR